MTLLSISHLIFESLLVFVYLHFTSVTGNLPEFQQTPTCSDGYKMFNSQLLITCQGFSSSTKVQWLKDGKSLGSSSYRYLKSSLTRQDSGYYQCILENSVGSVLSPRCNIKVAYLEKLPDSSPITVSATNGEAAILNLPLIKSMPKPSVTWKSGGNVIDSNQQRYITLDSNLVFLSVTDSLNNQQFSAEIMNPRAKLSIVSSPIYTLRISGNAQTQNNPKLVVPPKNTTVREGELANFECVVTTRFPNDLTIVWSRISNSRDISLSGGDKYRIDGFKLYIKRSEVGDAGVYKCSATLSGHQPIVHSAVLTVLSRPKILANLNKLMYFEYGNKGTLQCKASGVPNPKIQWYYNAKPISSLNNNKYKVLPNNDLEVSDVELADAGVYQCFAINSVGDSNTFAQIKVKTKAPVIHTPPHNISVLQESDAEFVCESDGAPKPTVQWKRQVHGGSEEPVINGGRFRVQEKSLIITVTQTQDTGRYTCISRNTLDEVQATAYLKVTIKTHIKKPPTNSTVIKGNPIDLSCEVTHDSSVQIQRTWIRYIPPINQREVLPSSKGRISIRDNGNLHISSVTSDDKGKYICEVISDGGNDSKEAYLKVVEIPHKPIIQSVVKNENEKRSVIVKWNKVFDGYSPIKHFRIQYRVRYNVQMLPDEGWVNIDENIDATKRSYVVRNLKPARNYTFRMTAVNAIGESSPSDRKPVPYIRLPEEVPGGPPQSFFGESIANDSIRLRWQAPKGHLWNGYLQGYIIRYWSSGYTSQTKKVVTVKGSDIISTVLRDLIVYHKYEIQMAAFNKAGTGVYSNTIQIQTQEGYPTAPPTSVSASAKSSTSIYIEWLPIQPNRINGILKKYIVTATRDGVPSEFKIVDVQPAGDTTQKLSVTVTQLRKYTKYQITVVGENGRGKSPQNIQPVSATTLEDVPGKVSDFKVFNVRDTKMSTSWKAPIERNGIIIGYIFEYARLNYTNTRKTNEFSPLTLSYDLINLKADTWYTLSIQAKTSAGHGPAYYTNIKSGVPPELPTPPTHLGVSDIEATSVLLQFHQGYNGKTSITLWIVEGDEEVVGVWKPIFKVSDNLATSFTVKNLRPYTKYRLRIIAKNIKGLSQPSLPTRSFQTAQKSPSSPPGSVTVRALNSTTVRVSWTPLAVKDWNGVPKGYNIAYRMKGQSSWKQIVINDVNSDSYKIGGLEEWVLYEVRMMAVNDVGHSDYGMIATERTREAVPSSAPVNIRAKAINSTAILVSWSDVPKLDQNGVVIGYKVQYTCTCHENLKTVVATVSSGTTYNFTIGGLLKFTIYSIKVLAFTNMGDGVYSSKAVSAQTMEGVPGPPVKIFFPEVTYERAKVVWEPPAEPNGIITGYKVSYFKKNESESRAKTVELGRMIRDRTVSGLHRATYYYFIVVAKTRLGWGEPAKVMVYTMINREVPESPTKPAIGKTGVTSRSITINWTPRKDGYGPLRNFTIEYKQRNDLWKKVPEAISPEARSHIIKNLRPNTWHQFRVAASNDIGISLYSPPSTEEKTAEDKPEGPPRNLAVKPLTTTSVKATWNPPELDLWNGELTEYVIKYCRQDLQAELYKTIKVKDPGISKLQFALTKLVRFTNYEVRVAAVNIKGQGPYSTPVTVYVGDAAPSGSPRKLRSKVLGSKEIRIMWEPPPPETHNGVLSGYMVTYWQNSAGDVTARRRISAENFTVLDGLQPYTEYAVTVAAINVAGNGPKAPVIFNKTEEEVPGKPRSLKFTDISHHSLKLTWTPPDNPNGVIVSYYLKYFPVHPKGLERNITETVKVLERVINNLKLNVTYGFAVWARTKKGPGESVYATVTMGPQPGSPDAPTKPVVESYKGGIKLSWTAGGNHIITGYMVEAKDIKGSSASNKWDQVLRINKPSTTATLSLTRSSTYVFRVFAVNMYGMSWPSKVSDSFVYLASSAVAKTSKGGKFYNEWWFLVIMALTGVAAIFIVISFLCLISRRQRNKNSKKASSIILPTQSSPPDNPGFSTLEMAPPIRDHSIRNGTLRSIGRNTQPRLPPQPTLRNIVYSDSDTGKGPIPDDSSSVSGKPSDLGDSPEPSDDDSEYSGKQPLPPPPMYYNNRSLRGSSRKPHHPNASHQYTNHHTQPPPYHRKPPINPFSYNSDSDMASSHYAASNASRILTNTPGSRAPVTCHSSFV